MPWSSNISSKPSVLNATVWSDILCSNNYHTRGRMQHLKIYYVLTITRKLLQHLKLLAQYHSIMSPKTKICSNIIAFLKANKEIMILAQVHTIVQARLYGQYVIQGGSNMTGTFFFFLLFGKP
jgi:hypothetical protein